MYSTILWRFCCSCCNLSKILFDFIAHSSYSMHFNLHIFHCSILYIVISLSLSSPSFPSFYFAEGLPLSCQLAAWKSTSLKVPHCLNYFFFNHFLFISFVTKFIQNESNSWFPPWNIFWNWRKMSSSQQTKTSEITQALCHCAAHSFSSLFRFFRNHMQSYFKDFGQLL